MGHTGHKKGTGMRYRIIEERDGTTGALGELEDDAVGEAFRVQVTDSRTYSYNWPRILKDFAETISTDAEEYTLFDAFLLLFLGDGSTRPPVIKISSDGVIRRLRAMAEAYGVALQIKGDTEIDPSTADLTAPHVGWTSKEKRSIEAVTRR